MFIWNEDMIRFLRDASEHSDYHHLLAEYLAKRLPENAHVCDAGCGLGYLSLAAGPLLPTSNGGRCKPGGTGGSGRKLR